jgi:N-carbamoylputrescine amidase
MKATVCQLPDDPAALEAAFAALCEHTQAAGADLVLLPEMPFHPWLAATDKVDPARWQAAVDAHEEWLPRLASLGASIVLGSRPTNDGAAHNDGFVWTPEHGASFAHRKYYLPDEPGFWEATWYRRAESPTFKVAQAGPATVGFMICTDLWFTEHARGYARQSAHIVVNPRATELRSADKWVAGGRAAAVMAGAYCLSSNRTGPAEGFTWGGHGWAIDPDGAVLALTSDAEPFVTVEIDLGAAEEAKVEYPRYVRE